MDPLLSDLCTFCTLRAPIYTCPRCTARTCSLACCRIHKSQRHCNGVRDPTAFIKRTQLITPSALDRDYNFLTSLERQLGIDVEHEKKARAEKWEKREQERVRAKLQDAGVRVRKVPCREFARARLNRTMVIGRKNKSKNLGWTIEWIFADSSMPMKEVDHAVSELQPIFESFFAKEERRKSAEGRKVRVDAYAFYLVLQAPANKKRCTKMDRLANWRTELRGREVLEFPSVLVTSRSEGPQGWEVVQDQRAVVEVKEKKRKVEVIEEDEEQTEPKKRRMEDVEGKNITQNKEDIMDASDSSSDVGDVDAMVESEEEDMFGWETSNVLQQTGSAVVSDIEHIKKQMDSIMSAGDPEPAPVQVGIQEVSDTK